ncbi:AMP-binding protein [Rhodococcus sp. 14C212]|uniref:AMP-binding protein n=1 Tax=Rhodococcus sp. 14C212 TaxID=2711209 RepID=UPI0013EDACAF|nr:AMP-binding protein [Rhodococcus sp. 14C212]NGP05760.1 AMP-binding protein [Rhodococcus sp. 14C212]
MITDPAARVHELLNHYDTSTACAATLLCDRHPADDVAFTVVEPDLSSTDLTYGQLRDQSTKFAAALSELGVGPGDHVATLTGKSADLVVALLGIWRRGAIHVPLFTAFASPAIADRLHASDTKVIICDADQLHKLTVGDDIPASPPWRVVVSGASDDTGVPDLAGLVAAYDDVNIPQTAAVVGGGGTLVQLFTSGTTGSPKGVPVPLRALASFHAYLEFGLDVRKDDVFWNAADPGWAYGLYYAILGPLAAGTRSILLHAGFSAPLVWQVMERFGVTNFTAAPTVYRSLLADPTAIPATLRLRCASSAGEPLTPDVIAWSRTHLNVVVRDHYGQTEHGMFIANAWADALRDEVHEGSMGAVLPGWQCAVLDTDSDTPAPPRAPGRVAIDVRNSPLMWFTGYTDAPEKTAQRFTPDGHWYLTGDAGHTDENGRFFFSARDDDVIIMAGYRIGPFDVESVLVMHPSVVEAAVVAAPDDLRGEVLEAFVVLHQGTESSDELEKELQILVKTKFAAHAYPRSVHFVAELPKTSSGKVQRYLLRQGTH